MLAYAHGEAAAAEADAVLRHGRACRECGDLLAMMLALREMDAVAPTQAPERGAAAIHGRRRLGAIAAAIVLAMLVGAVMVSSLLQPHPERDPGTGAAVDPALVARGRQLATRVPPDAVMAEFYRGSIVRAPEATRQQIYRAFALVTEERYDEAIRRLEPVYEQQPNDGEAAAVLGIARYLGGDDGDRTVELLRQGRAQRPADLSHLSAWYLGNLVLRRGEVVQAREVLEELSQWPDDPGVRAAALLDELRREVR
jgi:tetratricopeptide (TPR) repeat protein